MGKELINTLVCIDDEVIKKAWTYVSKMRGLEVVNETTLMEANGLLDDGDLIFSRMYKTANAELEAKKKSVSNLHDSIRNLMEPYEEARKLLQNRINMYAQFKREIASRERYEIGNSIEQDHKQIEAEYANQMLAERERLEKIRKEEWNRKIAGYLVDNPVDLLHSVILGEVTSSIISVNEKVLLEIGRRYQYKIKIPGIKWVWKTKKGEVLDEIS